MNIRYLGDKNSCKKMTTAELRASYLLDDLFAPGKIVLHYVDVDRTIVGSVVPTIESLSLTSAAELRAAYNYYGNPQLLALEPHPSQGAVFADDDVPSNLDPI